MPNLKAALALYIAVWLGTLLALPAESLARHGSDKAQAQALELRSEGAAALAEHRLDDAQKALYQSYERHPTPETLYFLGQLAAAAGRAIEAQDLLRRFLREAGEAVDIKQRDEANRILSQPIPAYGELDILGERGALLRVDERLLGVLPLSQPLLLAVGTHTVQLDQGSHHLNGPVEIRAGRTAQLRFDLRTGVAVVTLPQAVLLLEDYHFLPPQSQILLSLSVEQAIRSAELAVLQAPAALLRAPELGPCLYTRPCQEQLMQRNEVDFTLHLYVNPTPDGRGYELFGEILDAVTGDVAMGAHQPIDFTPGPSGQAPAAAFEMAGRLLREGRTRPRGTLSVQSTPPGAEVVLPRGPVGVTPYEHAAFAGPTEVTVQKEGYQPTHLNINVEAGGKGAAQVLLQPVEKQGLSRLPRWRIITGAIAVGVGGTAFGIGLLDLTLNASAQEGPSSQAISAVVIGGMIAAGGILLLTLPPSRPKRPPPAAPPS